MVYVPKDFSFCYSHGALPKQHMNTQNINFLWGVYSSVWQNHLDKDMQQQQQQAWVVV
jgi:hypothetical protein